MRRLQCLSSAHASHVPHRLCRSGSYSRGESVHEVPYPYRVEAAANVIEDPGESPAKFNRASQGPAQWNSQMEKSELGLTKFMSAGTGTEERSARPASVLLEPCGLFPLTWKPLPKNLSYTV